VIIIGAGAAGLFCAGIAGQRSPWVLLLDHSEKVAEKIRSSGGDRANFTNRELDAQAPRKYFLGAAPQFCRSAIRTTRRPTSWRWSRATASPSTKNTRASCFATVRPKT
jgi:predicted flavoprotein YhiN